MADDLTPIDIYPELAHEEDLTPEFGEEIDLRCEDIKAACEGFGTDESLLVDAIGATTPEERFKIALRYPEIYEEDLKDVFERETSGDFGLTLKMCSFGPAEAECYMIHRACKGIGSSNEDVLWSIVCGRSNRDMELLKKTYYRMYSEDLTAFLNEQVDGDLWALMSSCLQAAAEEFDPDFHTEDKAVEDAEALYEAGQGKWFGTDESALFKVIALAPREHLFAINEQYAEKYGHTIVKVMEDELGGSAESAAVFTCNMRLKPYEAIAKLIKHACAGFGTDDLLLMSCIIRYQAVMYDVSLVHEELFEKSVQDRVESECSGEYEKLLLALMDTVAPEE